MLAEIKGLNEECGVFGIWGHENAAQVSYYGLHSLQHRGQEGAGIVVNNGEKIVGHKGLGLISEVFSRGELEGLNGKSAIGMYDTRRLVEVKWLTFNHYYSVFLIIVWH